MPVAVLSAIRSCDVRLGVKNQPCLQMASSVRNMPQHSLVVILRSGGRALIDELSGLTPGAHL